MPRTNVDAPPVTPLSTAAAAAAPYAEALAAAAAPLRDTDDAARFELSRCRLFLSRRLRAHLAPRASKQSLRSLPLS